MDVSNEKILLKKDNSIVKYQNINPITNRSNINYLNDEPRIEGGQMIKIVESGPTMLQGRPIQLQLKPMILQNPQIQLFNPLSNFSVCPFCKYSGALEISYINSRSQRMCCIFLCLFGMFFLAWIPYLIKDLSTQVLKCQNCKKELRQIGDDVKQAS